MSPTASRNFGFLSGHDLLLLEIAASAENAFAKDPNATLVRLRQLAEYMSRTLAAQAGVIPEPDARFLDLIAAVAAHFHIDTKISRLFHHLRKKGNEAAHEFQQDHGAAVDALRSARELCIWHYRTFGNPSQNFNPGPFIHPRNWKEEDTALQLQIERFSDLLTTERKSSSADRARIAELQEQVETFRQRAEEHREDAVAAFTLAQEQSSKVDELTAHYERSLHDLTLQMQAEPADYLQLSARSREAAGATQADWAPEITLADAFAGDQLTDDQTALVRELELFLRDETTSVFQLKGFAGTGKTFVTRGFASFLAAAGRSCTLMAPTGKAARVLGKKSGRSASTIHAKIYSMDDVKEYKVADVDGSETYKFYAGLKVNDDPDNTVYIIDESSMVSNAYSEGEFFRFGTGLLLSDLMKYINLDHNDHSKKVVFIGDPAQLPPVGMASSPALDSPYLRAQFGITALRSHELSQVVRQASESAILKSALTIRNSITKKTFNRISIKESAPEVHLLQTSEEFVSSYIDTCEGKVSDNAMMIAFSNQDVAALNELARNRLFPGIPHVDRRDKLVVVTNCVVDGVALNNGDIVYVTKSDESVEARTVKLRSKNKQTGKVAEIEVSLQFRNLEIGYRGSTGKAVRARVKIFENLLYNGQPNLSSDESKALYIDFKLRNPRLPAHGKELRDALRDDPFFNALRVKFGYALTCHKAQGSEWNTAFVNCATRGQSTSSEFHFRWLYTAITRAKQKLILLNAPTKEPWSDIVAPTQPPRQGEASCQEAQSGDEPVSASADAVAVKTAAPDQGTPFSEHLRSLVEDLLNGVTTARIEAINHHSYQDSYFFLLDDESARVDISYNGRGIVTSIRAIPQIELGNGIAAHLMPLVGRYCGHHSTASEQEFPVFTREVFNEFFPVFLASAAVQGLSVSNVIEEPWNLRMTLSKSSTNAQIAIYCDGRGRIKSPTWIGKQPQDPALLEAFKMTLSNL